MVSPRQQQSEPMAPVHSSQGQSVDGGFRATLSDAGLWDLVQMKCQSRARCVAQINTASNSGELFFADGQIVHATWGSVQGEPAALEILSWREGSWDPCERLWPARQTIAATWQALLLRAAQLHDESLHKKERVSGVSPTPSGHARTIEVPRTTPPLTVATAVALQKIEERMPSRPPPLAATAALDSSINYRPDDFEHAVRLDPQSNVLTGHGNADELAALAAYVCRLGDLIGELMGIGELIALDGSLREGRCLIFRDDSGDTVALRPRPEIDLTRLKTRLGL